MNEEIRKWRAKYLTEEMFDDTDKARAFFMATPTSCFLENTIEQITENCRQAAEEYRKAAK